MGKKDDIQTRQQAFRETASRQRTQLTQSQTYGQLFVSQQGDEYLVSDLWWTVRFQHQDTRYQPLKSELGYLRALPGLGIGAAGVAQDGAIYRTDQQHQPVEVFKPSLWRQWDEREQMAGIPVKISASIAWVDRPRSAPHLDEFAFRVEGGECCAYLNRALLRLIDPDVRSIQRDYRLVLLPEEGVVRVQKHTARATTSITEQPVVDGSVKNWAGKTLTKEQTETTLEHEWVTACYLAVNPPDAESREEWRCIHNALPEDVSWQVLRDTYEALYHVACDVEEQRSPALQDPAGRYLLSTMLQVRQALWRAYPADGALGTTSEAVQRLFVGHDEPAVDAVLAFERTLEQEPAPEPVSEPDDASRVNTEDEEDQARDEPLPVEEEGEATEDLEPEMDVEAAEDLPDGEEVSIE